MGSETETGEIERADAIRKWIEGGGSPSAFANERTRAMAEDIAKGVKQKEAVETAKVEAKDEQELNLKFLNEVQERQKDLMKGDVIEESVKTEDDMGYGSTTQKVYKYPQGPEYYREQAVRSFLNDPSFGELARKYLAQSETKPLSEGEVSQELENFLNERAKQRESDDSE